MLPNLFLLFNHALTPEQRADARASLEAGEVVEPPEALRGLWSNLPPESEGLFDFLAPIRQWLAGNARPGDFVLIQGDFGACWLMVRYARDNGLRPVYSTTRRQAEELHQPNGTVKLVHHFRHVRFREYGK
ncbi:MAG: hypothetical protein EA399_01935 [Desulfovibrionales bacterium]|nr:MAG: hypothetical protein EA399_01935 [Desulfovibrionales bacterium]